MGGLGSAQIKRGLRKGNLEAALLKASRDNEVVENVCVSPEMINECFAAAYIFRKHKVQKHPNVESWAETFDAIKLEELMRPKKAPVLSRTPGSYKASFFEMFPEIFLKMVLQSNCEDCIDRLMLEPKTHG